MSLLKQGNLAFKNKDYKTAVELYNQALRTVPSLDSVIRFNLNYAQSKLESKSIETLPGAPLNTHTPRPVEVQQAEIEVYYYPKEHVAAPYMMNYQLFTIDIVIPVYNAFEDVKRCLESLEKQTDGFRVTTYIVNDASEAETTNFLREFCKGKPSFVLIEHEKNMMYSKTVNDGLRSSTADYVITLNSDTIVTKGWLQGLVRCMQTDEKIGVVGPLSNAASWQNVPKLLDEDNQFAVNEIPEGLSEDDMAELVSNASHHVYPRVPFVNGFCFMIARKVIEKVGYLDEETFPTGYGEENDYCLRVADAGFTLAIADDSYVFHAKSKSFGHEKRKEYSKNGSAALKAKHGKEKVNTLGGQIREMKVFDEIRARVQQSLDTNNEDKPFIDPLNQRVLFLLPVSGGGGGVHSIVQETMAMRRLGINAQIAVPKKHRYKFLKVYEDIDACEDLFLGFDNNNIDELIDISRKFDVIIGTIYTSMKMVKAVKEKNSGIISAYYIQDYEPLFSEPGTDSWQEAYDSYTLVPGTILFAKTRWICDKVFDVHGVKVHKVSPSIDHDVYKPDPKAKQKAGFVDKIVISAMIRHKTPRRGADRTMRLLKKVHDVFGNKIQIELFGCEAADPLFAELETNFEYTLHGVLTRNGVAEILKKSDLFMDLSDYQAFGRTGLESMACGTTLLSTKFGGVYEYVVDDENAILVDPFNEQEVFNKLSAYLEKPDLIKTFKVKSLLTASYFSLHRAGISELVNFKR